MDIEDECSERKTMKTCSERSKAISRILGGFPRNDTEAECQVNIGDYWAGEGDSICKGPEVEKSLMHPWEERRLAERDAESGEAQ